MLYFSLTSYCTAVLKFNPDIWSHFLSLSLFFPAKTVCLCRHPQNNLSYPNKPLPIKTFTGLKRKWQLTVHWDYSSIANFKTNISSIFRGIFGNFLWYFKHFYVVIPRYPTEPLRMSCRILVAKQWSRLRRGSNAISFSIFFLFPRTASDIIFFCQCIFDGNIFVKAGNVIGNFRVIITYPSIIRLNCLRIGNNFQYV